CILLFEQVARTDRIPFMFAEELGARENADTLQPMEIVIMIGIVVWVLLDREVVGQPLEPFDDGLVWFLLVAREMVMGDDQAGQAGTGHTAGVSATLVAPGAVSFLSFAEMLLNSLPDLAGNLDAGMHRRVQAQ